MNWLTSREAVRVDHTDFDELMHYLRGRFAIDHPSRKRFQEHFERYLKGFEKFEKKARDVDDATRVQVSINLNFTAPNSDLNRNQTNLANNLQRAFTLGAGSLEPLLLALANGPANTSEYLAALNQLLPEVFLNQETSTFFSSLAFGNDLFSCNAPGKGAVTIRQNECAWVRPKGQQLDFDGTSENVGFYDRTVGISAGRQFNFAPGLFVNFGLGYERGSSEFSTG